MTLFASSRRTHRVPVLVLVLVLLSTLGVVAPASAQVDPLIGVKRLPPNVVLVMDTSLQMLYDDEGNYYDVKTYNRSDDVTVATALGVSATSYRRIYRGLQFTNTQESNTKYVTTDIVAVQSSASGYSSFWAPTRFEMAKSGVAQAVGENPNLVRWGLLKLRQQGEAWRSTSTSSGCDKPVRVTTNNTLEAVTDSSPCAAGGGANRFVIYTPSVDASNHAQTGPGDSVVYAVGSTSSATNIRAAMLQSMGTGALIPAGLDTSAYVDRPIYNALADARTHISTVSAITNDTCKACRNTVVVLLTSGKDDGDSAYRTHASMSALASSFLAVGSPARRVPIVVIGLKPASADETELQTIATASGGRYFRAETAGDVAAAVNHAVQMGFTKPADFAAGEPSEYTFVSPVVGTVNLVNASSKTGTALPNTDVISLSGPTAGEHLPQRSNMLLTAGFQLPGFDGRLRAFRTFRPETDATKATGWRFVQDGTPLWPDLDDRPELAGLARTPLSPASRNIYTYVPDAIGGGQMVAFTTANASLLAPYLGSVDAEDLIDWLRAQPLGAVIGSTPAIMDVPSLDPPPDDDYGFPDSVGTFAGTYKNRRAMIFFGANDGMIHGVDARTGYEVWAFVPFNLLPKLHTLMDGQPIERFDYFVDSSPKVAEVKIGGAWKSMLIIGQSYGGTFYQAFDVSEAGMGVDPSADGLSAVNGLLARFDTPNESITFSWAFPRYSSFDHTVLYTNSSLGSEFPGGRVTMYGDLKSSASNVEKRVGFTFSDPAVGTLTLDRSVTAVMTGSGYFPNIEDGLPGRGGSAPAAGKAFFLLNAATGLPLGNSSGSSCSGTGCYDVGETINGRKNTIQADVTASGDAGSPVVSRAFVGDADGKYWRFSFTSTGAITATALVDTQQPIYSSSALLFVGTTDRYLFFGTGSDLLPNTAPAGGSTSGTAFRLYGVKDGSGSGTVVFSKDLSPKVLSATTNLLTNGERPTSSPTVAGDIVFFTTTTDVATIACNTDAYSRLYAFTFLGTAAYDTNGSGTVTNNESPIVATTTGRGTAPFIVDQHLFMGISSGLGAGVTIFGDPADFNNGVGQSGVRILSWREIR
jgi:hypothetical protein